MVENNETLTHILTAIGTLTIVGIAVSLLLAAGGLVLFFTDLAKIKHITKIETRIDSCLQNIKECIENDSTAKQEYTRHWDSYKAFKTDTAEFKTKTQLRLEALEKSKEARDQSRALAKQEQELRKHPERTSQNDDTA